ncbi:MAG: hypothetical protein IKK21_08390, partial [Clostridia bacterium]|nr:hypothetical protein [Clostridia bacterium]
IDYAHNEASVESLLTTILEYNPKRIVCRHAAEVNGALIAEVGTAFTQMRGVVNLYEPDDYHPSEAGSVLAAAVIARAIEAHERSRA